MVSFVITAGWKRWFVVRSYVPPDNQPMVHSVEKALAQDPVGMYTLLVVDLNVRLAQPCDWRE